MSDPAVARVVWQLERVERDLADAESSVRESLELLSAAEAALSGAERDDLRQGEQFTLGVIEGLVHAQLVARGNRERYISERRPTLGRPNPITHG